MSSEPRNDEVLLESPIYSLGLVELKNGKCPQHTRLFLGSRVTLRKSCRCYTQTHHPNSLGNPVNLNSTQTGKSLSNLERRSPPPPRAKQVGTVTMLQQGIVRVDSRGKVLTRTPLFNPVPYTPKPLNPPTPNPQNHPKTPKPRNHSTPKPQNPTTPQPQNPKTPKPQSPKAMCQTLNPNPKP